MKIRYLGNGIEGDYTQVRESEGGEKIKVAAGEVVDVSEKMAKQILSAYSRLFILVPEVQGDTKTESVEPCEAGAGAGTEGETHARPARRRTKKEEA
jgi:hypothetical protein